MRAIERKDRDKDKDRDREKNPEKMNESPDKNERNQEEIRRGL